MITQEMLRQGYDAGLVNLVMSPNGDGIVCGIGENWFYFTDLPKEVWFSIEECKKQVPKEEIVRLIYESLDEFRNKPDLKKEYAYYESYLREHGIEEKRPAVTYNLVDFAPAFTNRLNSPDLWNKIYKDQQVPEVLKDELLMRFPELKGKDVEFGVYSSSDKSAYLCAFCDGLAYRNMGVSWSCVGGAKIEKKIAGKRLKITCTEKGFGNNKPSINDLLKAADNRQDERRNGSGQHAKKSGKDEPKR